MKGLRYLTFFSGTVLATPFRQADLWKKQGKWGKENPSLELTFLQPILSSQLTLVLGGNSTRCSVCRPALALPNLSTETFHYRIHQIYDPSTAPPFSPLFSTHPILALQRGWLLIPHLFHYNFPLLSSYPILKQVSLSHPRKGRKSLIVGTLCILLKHLILQKYVISNQPILIVHLEHNQLFYCKITLSEK